MLRHRCLQRADFANKGGGMIDGGADLDEVLRVVEVAGEKIDLEAAARLHVGEFSLAALQLDEDGGFEGVVGIGFSTTIKDRDEGGIGRVGFARIHLAAFFRIGGDRDGLQKERVFQVGEEVVEVLAAPGDALRLKVGGELGDRKKTGGGTQQTTHQPAQRAGRWCGRVGS